MSSNDTKINSFFKMCADGNVEGIETLLKSVRTKRGRRKILETIDNHRNTCLHHAVNSQNVECVKYLLSMKGVNTLAETRDGETALHLACSTEDMPFEIISSLLEANPDLVNFVNNFEDGLLQAAAAQGRLDVVRLLVQYGAPVNKQDADGDTPLHIAAVESEVDIIRYLIYEANADPTICNLEGKSACFLLFEKLMYKILNAPPVPEDFIDCFEELAQFTFNIPDAYECDEDIINMLDLWSNNKVPINYLYKKIIRLFVVPPERQYFVQKIIESNIPNYHCLIVALLDYKFGGYLHDKLSTWDYFFRDLFQLYMFDESFFNEYIGEIMSTGWEYLESCQAENFCEHISVIETSIPPQKIFSFLKVLISFDINFDIFVERCEPFLDPKDEFDVLIPLMRCVIPRFPAVKDKNFLALNFNFNEPTNWYEFRKRTLHADDTINEVLSLKNLSRMHVRKYFLQKHTHYSALKALYNLDIPIALRNFVCYNFSNYTF